MNTSMRNFVISATVAALLVGTAQAGEFQLLTGVAPNTAPGAARAVVSTSGGTGQFYDGQRLGGTPSATPIAPGGPITYIQQPNQFGSLSYMFRRGSIDFGGPSAIPFISIDYLGGPLLDLDGDLNNGSRSLVPVAGQTAVPIPGSSSFIDLTVSSQAGTIALNHLDANANNAGAGPAQPDQLITVNTLAGTSPNGVPGGSINPGVDTRQGGLTPVAAGVTRIDNLGYEFWQDSLGASSTASTLGTQQFLGKLHGWLIERDAQGNFPTLAGMGLGSTGWPLVDTSQVGNTFNAASGPQPTATITDGRVPRDVFSAPGNGGLALSDFGGDLGAYLDAVVVPAVDPLSESFVYLEGAGFGISNSADPVFLDSVGYDVVLVAQSAPVPEPAAALLLAGAVLLGLRRRGN